MSRAAFLIALGFGLLFGLVSQGQSGEKSQSKPKIIKLYNGKDFTGWQKYCGKKNVDLEQLFSIDPFEKHLVIKGKALGYLITEKDYENYELTLEWRWGLNKEEPSAQSLNLLNSGVLLHVTGPDKIWPKSVEAQLQYGRAGDFWLIDGFRLKVDRQQQDPKNARHFLRLIDDVENSPGDWNTYVITCLGKKIKLNVNGKDVNEGSESELSKGKIAIQAEGWEIHLRNISLKSLK